jgi:hypothetical protein
MRGNGCAELTIDRSSLILKLGLKPRRMRYTSHISFLDFGVLQNEGLIKSSSTFCSP